MNEKNGAKDARDSSAAARLTPYELVFGGDEYEARVFPRICTEVDDLGVDPLLRDQFSMLSVAGEAVREVIPPEAPAEALEQYRSLLYHAFNFWRYGKRVYFTETPVARFLVEAAPQMRDWELVLPHPSIYVQLPANLFWASVSPDSTPEPVDGFFVTASDQSDPLGGPFKRLHVLLVLGIRRERAGFSVISFDSEAGPGIAAAWAETAGREAGADFENVLPGGDISGLYSILTSTEVLKLLGRVLWYLDVFPEEVVLETAPERRSAERPDSPPRPRIPYHRVSLGGHPAGPG